MRLLSGLLALALLASCGADGEPIRPTAKVDAPPIGLSISGTAEIGISG